MEVLNNNPIKVTPPIKITSLTRRQSLYTLIFREKFDFLKVFLIKFKDRTLDTKTLSTIPVSVVSL